MKRVNRVEDVQKLSESQHFSKFEALATLFKGLKERTDRMANESAPHAKELAIYLRGVAYGYEIAWWLMREQARSRRGEASLADFAPAFEAPTISVLESAASSIRQAYELACARSMEGAFDGRREEPELEAILGTPVDSQEHVD